MPLFCYCSEILPGKKEKVRAHWQKKRKDDPAFWQSMKMTGFEAFLQGDLMIHCLEGSDLSTIFKGLRESISKGNPTALGLQQFYLEVLGKDYAKADAMPKIEQLLDITLEKPSEFIKRAFVFPLLPGKEEAHRAFRKEAMSSKKERHEASLRAFGVYKMTSWLQETPHKKYIVVYTENHVKTPATSKERLSRTKESPEWNEIARSLCDQTGLRIEELSPQVEWVTKSV